VRLDHGFGAQPFEQHGVPVGRFEIRDPHFVVAEIRVEMERESMNLAAMAALHRLEKSVRPAQIHIA
jgi:hypothetical protein